MRKLRWSVLILAVGVELVGGIIYAFRRNPRMGSSLVNSVVNPVLIGRGLAGRGKAEIATLENFGRRTGQRRLTPVHPEPTPDGFRIMVPLGIHSEWARNVISAGHCRLQLHDEVYDLDEPTMVQPRKLDGLPMVVRRFEEYLGFQYLTLRRFNSAPGSLDTITASDAAPLPADIEPTPELVGAAH